MAIALALTGDRANAEDLLQATNRRLGAPADLDALKQAATYPDAVALAAARWGGPVTGTGRFGTWVPEEGTPAGGAPEAILIAVAGRPSALADLSGDGLPVLAGRVIEPCGAG